MVFYEEPISNHFISWPHVDIDIGITYQQLTDPAIANTLAWFPDSLRTLFRNIFHKNALWYKGL